MFSIETAAAVFSNPYSRIPNPSPRQIAVYRIGSMVNLEIHQTPHGLDVEGVSVLLEFNRHIPILLSAQWPSTGIPHCTLILPPGRIVQIDRAKIHGPRMNDKTDWNRTCFNHMYRLRRCMWIPTKKSLAISTGNRYLPVRKFVSSGANFRVPFCLAQNPQILRDRLTHSCVSRGP